MGGCASKPKDLDLLGKSTAVAPLIEKPVAPQENDGGEVTKPEEDVENPSESKEEEAKHVDVAVSPEPVKDEADLSEDRTSEDKSDEPLITI